MGFEITRFESTVDDELICAICEGVLQNPIQVISCEHVFCSNCLDEWIAKGKKNCPLDREEIRGREDMKAPRIVINLLAKLTIRCDFAQYGCPAIVRLENLTNHCEQCQYNPDKPFKCNKGCGLVLANRCELDAHNCMEELHNLVRGQTQQIETQTTLLEELRIELVGVKESNAKMENELKELKQLIVSFQLRLSSHQNQSQKVMDCLSKCAEEMQNCQKQVRASDDSPRESKYFVQFKDNCLEVDPFIKIGDIKRTFMKSLNIRSGKLKLFDGSNELDDMKSLSEYGIEPTADSRLSLIQCDEVQVFVKVRVMNSKDNVRHPYLCSDFLPKTVALRIDRNATIGQMKAEIKLIHNMVCEDELLTYGTINLEDQFNLTYYNITDGSFINYYAHL